MKIVKQPMIIDKLKIGVVSMDIISVPVLLGIILFLVGIFIIIFFVKNWAKIKKKKDGIDPNEIVVKNQDEL
jgi:hypothetical protein